MATGFSGMAGAWGSGFHTSQEHGMVSNSRQQGFTLVEIAIVLVIIGLLIGGVLK